MKKNNTTECELITGEKREVLTSELTFRPAVYALVYDDPRLLLVNTKSTGKWFFPGGAIERGERTEGALRREVQEETGIIIDQLRFFTFRESFFYYEPHDQGYHSFNLFYTAEIQSKDSKPIDNDPTDEANSHAWVDINSLHPEDMQSFAGEVLLEFVHHGQQA